jgi:hypothetical protein
MQALRWYVHTGAHFSINKQLTLPSMQALRWYVHTGAHFSINKQLISTVLLFVQDETSWKFMKG